MKKVISTAMTQANISAVIDVLTETPTALERLTNGLSGEQLRQPLGEGERSVVENLAHMINSEERIAESIYLALLVDEPLIADVHPERDWGKLLLHDKFEFGELLAYFQFRQKVLLRVLGSLKEAQWARVIREVGKQRKESIYWRARTLAMHELDHMVDMERKLGGEYD